MVLFSVKIGNAIFLGKRKMINGKVGLAGKVGPLQKGSVRK